jgi:putative ABC transport system ATP-binding protein
MSTLVLEDIGVDVSGPDRNARRILDHLSLTLHDGAMIAIAGPSGAGKTTLLHAIAGIVQPAQGRVVWDGQAISDLSEGRRDRWRRNAVGMVFQNFHLIGELSALDNILLPFTFDHAVIQAEQREAAQALAASIGLDNLAVRAQSLSRGEQQRVAIARALIRKPKLLLADEPTASLDTVNAAAVGDLLLSAARETNAMLVVATHDEALLARIPRRLRVEAGHAVSDEAA